MSTENQINANRQNDEYSTGPVTDSGKTASSPNALTLGLYTRADYVKPDEQHLYKEFCETMYSGLAPDNLLEQCLTSEITGATWRLRRCSAVEGNLADAALADPMLDDKTEKTLRAIERTRASSHSLLHRSVNQLRKLQTDRLTRCEILSPGPVPAWTGIADYKQISAAVNALRQSSEAAPSPVLAELASIMAEPGLPPELSAELLAEAVEKERRWNEMYSESASICKPAPLPRNSPCPCGSGEKYKRCCARTGPGWSAPVVEGAKIAA